MNSFGRIFFLCLFAAVLITSCDDSSATCDNYACLTACTAAGHPSGVCSAGACECLEQTDGDADGDADAQTCQPGQTQSCVCARGGDGAQICDDDGQRWGTCDCDEPDGDADADGDGDGDGDADADADGDSDADGDADGCEAEICNGEDDDCDGRVDEDFECARGEEIECLTFCGSVVPGNCLDTCEIPNTFECEPLPAEICENGEDDDCDGEVDPEARLLGDVRAITEDGEAGSIAITWTGSEYGVAWADDSLGQYEIFFARLNVEGVQIGPPTRITNAANDSLGPEIVWTGTEYALTWIDRRSDSTGIYFTRVSAAGLEVGDERRLTEATTSSDYPSLVWNSAGFGLGWTEYRDGSRQIYFMELSATGEPDGEVIRVTDGDRDRYHTSLAWTGSEYGLAWTDHRESAVGIYYALIAPDTFVTEDILWVSEGFATDAPPSIVWTGSEFVVAWQSRFDPERKIVAARITSDGVLVATPRAITEDLTGIHSDVSLHWNGSRVGATWFSYETSSGNDFVALTELDSDGDISGAVLHIGPIGDGNRIGITWTGSEYGLTWIDAYHPQPVHFARAGGCW